MPAQKRPPIRLAGEAWTRKVQEKVAAIHARIPERAKGLWPDGKVPGTIELEGREKLSKYLAATTDLTDFPKILDPEYEMRIRAGMDEPPVSTFWLNALMIPGEFSKMGKEFARLLERYSDESP